ncbi:MAG: DUF1328 domain-containing protein [Gemmataceae bacterium]
MMFRWALVFVIFTLLAGVLGFTVTAHRLALLSHVLFFVFLGLAVYTLLAGQKDFDRLD